MGKASTEIARAAAFDCNLLITGARGGGVLADAERGWAEPRRNSIAAAPPLLVRQVDAASGAGPRGSGSSSVSRGHRRGAHLCPGQPPQIFHAYAVPRRAPESYGYPEQTMNVFGRRADAA
jgi:hypothetical protein